MNICLDCNSAYREPGTCNCYAPGGKRAQKQVGGNTDKITIRTVPEPAKPEVTWVPLTEPAEYWLKSQGQWTVRAEQCDNCGGTFVGSHVCGYYNPNRGPHYTSIGMSWNGVG